jgi:AcrR family transcriptional regulator
VAEERQARAVRTRRTLLYAAARLFDRYGYTRTRIGDISAAAGVSSGALHFHFENKAALAAAVEEAGADILWSAGWIAYQANADALQALTDMSQAFARLLQWDVLARAGFRLGADGGLRGSRGLDREWQGCVERLLLEAARNDELSAHVQLHEITCAVLTATTGVGLLIRGDSERQMQAALTGFWQAFLPGLARPEVARRLEPAGRLSVVTDAVAVSGRARARAAADRPGRAAHPQSPPSPGASGWAPVPSR